MCIRRPNWFATPFSTISSACKSVTTVRSLVLYPAFEQSFFVHSTVLLLFRAATHSHRLHSAWTGVWVPMTNCTVRPVLSATISGS
jgi:hypothetical protein